MKHDPVSELEPASRTIALEVRELVRLHLAPAVRRHDADGTFPHQALLPLAQSGLCGMLVPVAFGGRGWSVGAFAAAIEEVACVDGGMALTLMSHNALAAAHLCRFGRLEQQQQYLPSLASGSVLGAWALSETRSGSDPGGLRTRAVPDGDGWRLDGVKAFVTQGTVAGLYIVMARTSPAPGRDGISAFLVEAGTPGVKPSAPLAKMGCRSSDTATVVLRNVRLPAAALLGIRDHALSAAYALLDVGRVGIAAMAVGLGRAALAEAVAFARKRHTFGQPIAAHQAVQWMVADMATEIDAARLLLRRAAALADAGIPCVRESAMAKLYAAEAASRAANKALQIHGGYGYLRALPIERILRDAKLCEIGEGTSEIQRLVIAREVLKKKQEKT
jgi:alkylation response protein AidB-like acyl-CoA dehydrogenase